MLMERLRVRREGEEQLTRLTGACIRVMCPDLGLQAKGRFHTATHAPR
jgi:hypothetical protein